MFRSSIFWILCSTTAAAVAAWSFFMWQTKPIVVPPDTGVLLYLYSAIGFSILAVIATVLSVTIQRHGKADGERILRG